MEEENAIVQKILGSRPSKDFGATTIGLVASGVEYKFDFSPDLLIVLALTALRAKTVNEERAAASAPDLQVPMQAFIGKKWEIRLSPDKSFFVISFLVAGGAWVRVQIPTASANAIQSTLQKINNQEEKSRTSRKKKNMSALPN